MSILTAMPDPDRAAAHRRREPAALSRRARAPRQHRLRLVHARRRQPGRRRVERSLRELGAERRADRRSNRPTATAARRPRHRAARGDGPRLLLIGHMDTVFDPGTAAARPFRSRATRHGPGVTDMKGGLLAGLYALAALHERRRSAGGDLRRQPGRGDRLAVQRPAHPRARAASTTRRWSWSAPVPTATSSAPARASPTSG